MPYGKSYGKIDINRISDCVNPVEGRICFEAKALDSPENLDPYLIEVPEK